jgi:hypothetical protein
MDAYATEVERVSKRLFDCLGGDRATAYSIRGRSLGSGESIGIRGQHRVGGRPKSGRGSTSLIKRCGSITSMPLRV